MGNYSLDDIVADDGVLLDCTIPHNKEWDNDFCAFLSFKSQREFCIAVKGEGCTIRGRNLQFLVMQQL